MLFYHRMYPWKRVSIWFSYFLSLIERNWGFSHSQHSGWNREEVAPNPGVSTLCAEDTLPSTQGCVYCLSTAFPTSFDMLAKCGHLLPRNVYISSLLSSSAWLSWRRDSITKDPSSSCHTKKCFHAGRGLFLKVVFLFSICLFYLYASLVMNILRNSQRELLGNGLFYLQKSLLFKKLPDAVLLSCFFQYNPPV